MLQVSPFPDTHILNVNQTALEPADSSFAIPQGLLPYLINKGFEFSVFLLSDQLPLQRLEKLSLYYLPITGKGRIKGFMPFPRAFSCSKMQRKFYPDEPSFFSMMLMITLTTYV